MSRLQLSVCFGLTAILTLCRCEAKPGGAPDNLGENHDGRPDASRTLSTSSATLLFGKSSNIDVSKPYGYHLEPVLNKIKAVGGQRLQIASVVQSYRSKIQPLRDEYRVKKQEFITVMTSGGAAETIMARQMELSHLATDITGKYTLMRLEVRRLLNPEQILLFEEYARDNGWNAR